MTKDETTNVTFVAICNVTSSTTSQPITTTTLVKWGSIAATIATLCISIIWHEASQGTQAELMRNDVDYTMSSMIKIEAKLDASDKVQIELLRKMDVFATKVDSLNENIAELKISLKK